MVVLNSFTLRTWVYHSFLFPPFFLFCLSRFFLCTHPGSGGRSADCTPGKVCYIITTTSGVPPSVKRGTATDGSLPAALFSFPEGSIPVAGGLERRDALVWVWVGGCVAWCVCVWMGGCVCVWLKRRDALVCWSVAPLPDREVHIPFQRGGQVSSFGVRGGPPGKVMATQEGCLFGRRGAFAPRN